MGEKQNGVHSLSICLDGIGSADLRSPTQRTNKKNEQDFPQP